MQIYHIYKQIARPVLFHDSCIGYYNRYNKYKWLPFTYLTSVCGTENLYKTVRKHLRQRLDWPVFHDSFAYDTEPFRIPTDCNLYTRRQFPTVRYLITDITGKVRNYYELTDCYKQKRHVSNQSQAYQYHAGNTISEQRKNITPEEIQEYRNEYGLYMPAVKPKRKFDTYHCKVISKGWKKQSKRTHQYKNKNPKSTNYTNPYSCVNLWILDNDNVPNLISIPSRYFHGV